MDFPKDWMEKHPSAAKVPWVEPDVRTCVLPIGFHDDLAKKLDALKQMQEGEAGEGEHGSFAYYCTNYLI